MQPWTSTSSARISYRNASLIVLSLAHVNVNGADIEGSNFRTQHVPNRNSYEYTYTHTHRKDSTSLTSERISSSSAEPSKNLRKVSVQLAELESRKELKPQSQFSNQETPEHTPNYEYQLQYYSAPSNDDGDRGDVEWWPWHHDDDNDNDDGKDDTNKTDDDNTNPSDNTDDNSNNSDCDDTSPATDNSCASHVDCTTCYASSSTCHWCAFDNQCHAKASWYGCSLGANCDADNNDNDDNTHNSTSSDDDTTPSDGGGNKKKDNSCSSHSTCSECSLSSHVCHWCEKDNACHAIGSWYGCAHGANCYSNHRCRRIEPEVMEPWSWWKMASQMGVAPLALVGILAFMVICCSSVLFTGVKALKGAYEDLDFVERSNAHVAPISLDPEEIEGNRHSPLSSMDRSEEAKDTSDSKHSEIHESQPLLKDQIDENLEFVDEESDSQLHSPNSSSSTLGSGTMLSRQSVVTPHPSISRLPTSNSHRSSSHMACFMTTCRIWYFLIILSVFLFSSGYIYFFPKTPLYNVCSDEIAWRSIIDGMTSLKMKASFEILMSIQNPNHLDITLDSMGGTFKHDGQDVGTFTVPKATIKRTSITDVLVTCSVVPDKWEALGLISDYYKGQLFFSVNVNGNIEISGIGYSIPVQISDYIVRVNDPDMDDRHLCACPQWSDLVPSLSPLPVPDFLYYQERE